MVPQKRFEAPKKIVKIKILFNFFSSSGIETGKVKDDHDAGDNEGDDDDDGDN